MDLRRMRTSPCAPLVAMAVVLVVVGFAVSDDASPRAIAQGQPRLALDANASNGSGPCDPLDDSSTVAVGSTYDVAICIVDPPGPVIAFELRVGYDPELVAVPERSDSRRALDDNPDVNAGETTFSGTDLGTGWDCTGFGQLYPTGDDRYSEEIDITLVCNADLIEPDANLSSSGPLAVITLEALDQGPVVLEFLTNTNLGTGSQIPVDVILTCGLAPQVVPCDGVVIDQGDDGSSQPEAAAASPSEGDGNGFWSAGTILVTLAVVVAVIAAAAALAVRRRTVKRS